MTQTKKRFIAGAVCPKCSAMDRIVMFKIDDKDYRECVECGFEDVMHFAPKTQELETRVNTPDEVKKEQTQVIRFVVPGDKSQ